MSSNTLFLHHPPCLSTPTETLKELLTEIHEIQWRSHSLRDTAETTTYTAETLRIQKAELLIIQETTTRETEDTAETLRALAQTILMTEATAEGETTRALEARDLPQRRLKLGMTA